MISTGKAFRVALSGALCLATSLPDIHGELGTADGQVCTISYLATPIISGEYPAVVCRAMRSAKRSIKIVMFSISAGYSPKNPMSLIMDECIGAAKRGVRVTVIADWCDHADGNLYAVNTRTLDYLRENGVDTYFDSPKTKTHDKLVLIDDATLIMGSHNWSKAAMTKNAEASIMITSAPPDPAFARYFEEIKSSCVPSRL